MLKPNKLKRAHLSTTQGMRGLGKSFLLMTEKAHQTITGAIRSCYRTSQCPEALNWQWAVTGKSVSVKGTSTEHLWGHGGGRRQWRVTCVLWVCHLDSSAVLFLPHWMVGPAEVREWPSGREALCISITENRDWRQMWPGFSTGHTHGTAQHRSSEQWLREQVGWMNSSSLEI